jgi:hypothetical protein
MIRDSPPLWKLVGYSNKEEYDFYTVCVFGAEEDSFYMATKCPNGEWIVWINVGYDSPWSQIAFSTWKEAVIFLYEECIRLGAEWDPYFFGFKEGIDPSENEPDFVFDRSIWDV